MSSEHYVKPALKFVDGLALPKYVIEPEAFRWSCSRFPPREGDVFVITYPTSGTAFVQNMVWNIVTSGAALPKEQLDLNCRYFPLLEMITGQDRMKAIRNCKSPRLLKTHTPATHAPYSTRFGKYIYVARNPKDSLVSYYYLHLELPQIFGFRGNFDDFFYSFINGHTAWGNYFDHVLSWFGLRDNENVLFLSYEKMTVDQSGTILRIGNFLGIENHANELDADRRRMLRKIISFLYAKPTGAGHSVSSSAEEECGKIRHNDHADFARYRSASDANEDMAVIAMPRRNFGIGVWRTYLSEEQNQQMDQMIVDKLGGTYLCDLWRSKHI